MQTILLSPFFLLFCATSAVAAYLGHRFFIVKAVPTWGDQCLAVLAGFESLSLVLATYQIRNGTYRVAQIDPGAATVATTVAVLAVAVVTIECLLASNEAEEK